MPHATKIMTDKLKELELKLKSLEEELRDRPREIALRFYEERLGTIGTELDELETTIRELTRYEPMSPKRLEKAIASTAKNHEKLVKQLEALDKKLEDAPADKPKARAKLEAKLKTLKFKLDDAERAKREHDKRKELQELEKDTSVEHLRRKRALIIEQRERIEERVRELKGEPTRFHGEGANRCIVCGARFDGDTCMQCGARVITTETRARRPSTQVEKLILLLRYGTLFFVLGLLMIVIGVFLGLI